MTTPLVSASWLHEHLNMPNLVVLNATLAKVGSTTDQIDQQIQGARNFDIKNSFSDRSSALPNTLPSSSQFEHEAAQLGINQDSFIVVYDEHGIYSSPRAWWLFKTFGHQQVVVLDGGLPAWIVANLPTVQKHPYQGPTGNFKADKHPNTIKQYQQVLDAIEDTDKSILDARAATRFTGDSPEPRQGLRSGHIPRSINLPYSEVLNNNRMKNVAELIAIFTPYMDQEVIMSCGSGITACILALGADLAGHTAISVYDGSWTEWGTNKELPIETNAN